MKIDKNPFCCSALTLLASIASRLLLGLFFFLRGEQTQPNPAGLQLAPCKRQGRGGLGRQGHGQRGSGGCREPAGPAPHSHIPGAVGNPPGRPLPSDVGLCNSGVFLVLDAGSGGEIALQISLKS